MRFFCPSCFEVLSLREMSKRRIKTFKWLHECKFVFVIAVCNDVTNNELISRSALKLSSSALNLSEKEMAIAYQDPISASDIGLVVLVLGSLSNSLDTSKLLSHLTWAFEHGFVERRWKSDPIRFVLRNLLQCLLSLSVELECVEYK